MDQVTLRSDTVLSDVHLLVPNAQHLMTRLNGVGQPVFVSKLRILWNGETTDECGGNSPSGNEKTDRSCDLESLLDEDGDLDVARRPADVICFRDRVNPIILSQASRANEEEEDDTVIEEDKSKDVIVIEHTMATPLEDVGKQIWRGALLFADFILSHPAMFQGATVLELGAGTGLTSIVMARIAKMVYCTDVGEDLLSMCQRNMSLNKHHHEPAAEHSMKVRQLDWTKDDFLTDTESEFGWSEEEVADLHDNTAFVIAADVCYDDDLTDALFKTLYKITSQLRNPSTAYFCIEKRLNFSIRHLEVTCEAYDHFRHCLTQLEALSDGKTRFTVEPVPADFPQFFQYERVEQLELWKVSVSSV